MNLVCKNANRKSQNLSPFSKLVENLPDVSGPQKINRQGLSVCKPFWLLLYCSHMLIYHILCILCNICNMVKIDVNFQHHVWDNELFKFFFLDKGILLIQLIMQFPLLIQFSMGLIIFVMNKNGRLKWRVTQPLACLVKLSADGILKYFIYPRK